LAAECRILLGYRMWPHTDRHRYPNSIPERRVIIRCSFLNTLSPGSHPGGLAIPAIPYCTFIHIKRARFSWPVRNAHFPRPQWIPLPHGAETSTSRCISRQIAWQYNLSSLAKNKPEEDWNSQWNYPREGHELSIHPVSTASHSLSGCERGRVQLVAFLAKQS
jgi:hypothetical protein